MAEEMKTGTEQTEQEPNVTETQTEEAAETAADNAEMARLRAELAKQKAAIDKATKEAADYKRQLRAKQSAEEIAAEELKTQTEARDKELNELRKRFAVMETSKNVLVRVGGDETAASKIAEYLYGAEDVDGALNEIQKIIAAKEKAIRAEFGKVPPPGIGASDGATMTKAEILNIKDSVARQKAIAENIHLFT